MGVSLFLGMIAAIIPAWNAMRFEPISVINNVWGAYDQINLRNRKDKFILLTIQFTIGFIALLFGLGCIKLHFSIWSISKETVPLR